MTDVNVLAAGSSRIMDEKHIERVMALSGLYQAATLVQQIAREGTVEAAPFETSIDSLFRIESASTEAIYGSWATLRCGLGALVRELERKERDLELTRYAACLLFLERKIMRRQDLLKTILDGIDVATAQADYFSATHDNVLANLADIYQKTVSTLSPRIMVSGTPAYLNNPDNANKIRALLLAGLRATVLWRQLGGNRLQLIFSRRNILHAAQHKLAQIRA